MDQEPIIYEQLVDLALGLLGEPRRAEQTPDGATVIVAGDPEEVVVRLTHRVIEVAEYYMTWDGPYTARMTPRRIGIVNWRRVDQSRLTNILTELIASARITRRRKFRQCKHCQKMFGPEDMHGNVCHGCAERYEGVVH